jgi:DNA-binding transcriptional regulator YdaS (Cro superfamily)
MQELVSWRKSLDGNTLEEAGKLLGVSGVQVHRYEKGTRKIPATKVAEVERITGIPRERLRPDIFEGV